MQKEILEELAAGGLFVSAVPASHLPELKAELERVYQSGQMSEGLYDDMMGFCQFEAPAGMLTVLSVASPVPISSLSFTANGRTVKTMLPPTYAEHGKYQPKIEAELNEVLGRYGYHAAWFQALPQKMLAVCSGLGQYGRNNVCYVKGAGSFVLLSSYVTDMPCEQDTWRQPERMEYCGSCSICHDSCPTGAISMNRQVIDASRCLTNLNENPEAPFPDWLDPHAHHCIVGCMRCQAACPQNARYLDRLAEPVDFDEQETAMILANGEYEQLPETLQAKLEAVGLKWYYTALPRNINAVFNAGTK